LRQTEKDGEIQFEAPAPGLALTPGVNALDVSVVNDGGEARLKKPVLVSYTRLPVTVIVEGLEDPQDLRREVIRPVSFDQGQPVFPVPLRAGRWLVRGRVEWTEETSPELRDRLTVRAAVNDFDQFLEPLDDAAGLVRRFKAPIRLNQTDNKVVLKFNGVKLASPPTLALKCANPDLDQRLHLIVIAPGHTDPAQLRTRVLKAFRAEKVKGNSFSTGAFREGEITLLEPDVNRGEIGQALKDTSRQIEDSRSKLNDVIVVYFQGKEVLEEKTQYLLTLESEKRGKLAETAVNCDRLREQLADFTGAKLVLLDVNRKKEAGARGGKLSDWAQAAPAVGVLRIVHLAAANTPEQVRLLDAMNESLARAGLLREVRDRIEARALELRDTAPGLFFNWYTPEGLERMRLGAGGGQ
jgi:hypothetical protein